MPKANKVRKKSISRELYDEARAFFRAGYDNRITEKAFSSNYRKFINFCRERGAKTKDDCADFIQPYADFLIEKGYTPSTVHSYLAPVCIYHNVNLHDIKKPKRHAADYSKSRRDNQKLFRNDNDLDNPAFSRTVEFAKRVGIRRAEMRRLTGDDFVTDESGHPCVRVSRGKGGKMQLQRIREDDVPFIREYFTRVKPDERVFSAEEMRNKLPYHYLRAKHAQSYYRELLTRFRNDPSYRDTVQKEIVARWKKYNLNPRTGRPKHLPADLLTGKYRLRGQNKALAIANGMPTVYDRLALMATSVFALSHWRCDVTVASYLLVK